MSEKPKWQKTWNELSKKEQTPEEWDQRTEKICPFTRKPCMEMIDPQKSQDEPENWRACAFYNPDFEECRAIAFLREFESLESLIETLGVFLHKQITGSWPKRDKNLPGIFWPQVEKASRFLIFQD